MDVTENTMPVMKYKLYKIMVQSGYILCECAVGFIKEMERHFRALHLRHIIRSVLPPLPGIPHGSCHNEGNAPVLFYTAFPFQYKIADSSPHSYHIRYMHS